MVDLVVDVDEEGVIVREVGILDIWAMLGAEAVEGGWRMSSVHRAKSRVEDRTLSGSNTHPITRGLCMAWIVDACRGLAPPPPLFFPPSPPRFLAASRRDGASLPRFEFPPEIILLPPHSSSVKYSL